jgi:hypothetical protein
MWGRFKGYPQNLNYPTIVPIKNIIAIIRLWKQKINGRKLKV